ncbi:MAG: 2OG-Fe(II) oxygenase [Parvularculaceae bacterium]|nr:2OG-Fe(II) oxygenase [Parvularculaceae bacterium]
MNTLALDEAIRRAEAGDAQAQYALAAFYARAGQRDEANKWLADAAANGEPEALFTLATRLTHTEAGVIDAAPRLAEAAAKGSPSAAHFVAVLTALGLGFPKDEAAAIASIVQYARGGLQPMRRQLAALLYLQHPDDPDAAALLTGEGVVDWSGVERRVRLSPPAPPAPERLSASPDVVLFRGVIPRAVCAHVIAHAAARLGPALVYDPNGTGMMRDPLRSSATASLSPVDLDLAIIVVNRALSACAGLPDEQGEFLSVMRYRPGEEYRPHFDTVPPGPDFDRNGQRVKTALLYLNDDYDGGETAFLTPGLTVKGAAGDIVVFSNVTADGRLDGASRHAGLAVTAGEKWLASKWFRAKKFSF